MRIPYSPFNLSIPECGPINYTLLESNLMDFSFMTLDTENNEIIIYTDDPMFVNSYSMVLYG